MCVVVSEPLTILLSYGFVLKEAQRLGRILRAKKGNVQRSGLILAFILMPLLLRYKNKPPDRRLVDAEFDTYCRGSRNVEQQKR